MQSLWWIEGLLFSSIFVFGAVVLLLSGRYANSYYFFGASFLLGSVIWAIFFILNGMIITIFDVDWSLVKYIHPITFYTSLTLLVIRWVFDSFSKKDHFVPSLLLIFGATLVFVFTTLTHLFFPYVITTHDSLWFLNINFEFPMLLRVGRPLVLMAFQSISLWSGYQLTLPHLPLMSLSSLLVMYGFTLNLTRSIFDSRFLSHFISLVSVVIFGCSFMFLYNFNYLNHHVLVAGLLLLVAYLFVCQSEEEADRCKWVVSIALIGVSLARMEGVAFTILFCLSIVTFLNLRAYARIVSAIATFQLPWCAYVAWSSGEVGKVSGSLMLLLAVTLVGIVIWAWYLALQDKQTHWLRQYGFSIILLVFLILTFVFSFLDPRNMVLSLSALYSNLTTFEFWGSVWIYALCSISLCLIATSIDKEVFSRYRYPKISMLLRFSTITFMFLIVSVFFRVPYRISLYDSGNRMAIQILPLIIVYVVYCQSVALRKIFSKEL